MSRLFVLLTLVTLLSLWPELEALAALMASLGAFVLAARIGRMA